eukprot:scaffold33436_cov54-Phaeocystis_antarctica.AAC.4
MRTPIRPGFPPTLRPDRDAAQPSTRAPMHPLTCAASKPSTHASHTVPSHSARAGPHPVGPRARVNTCTPLTAGAPSKLLSHTF